MKRYSEVQPHKIKKQQQAQKSSINKISLHFPTFISNFQEQNTPQFVEIYLRQPTKKSFKINVSSKISLTEIKTIAQQKIGIPRANQILYLNGKNITQYGHIRLQLNSIIHISNTKDCCETNGFIQLKLNVMNFLEESNKNMLVNYKLSALEIVGDFIQRVKRQLLNASSQGEKCANIYLLQSSRLLEKDKSFQEQDISKYTEVICMITQNQIKTRFSNDTKQEIMHDISELLGFEEDNQTKKEPMTIAERKNIRKREKNLIKLPKKQQTQIVFQQNIQKEEKNNWSSSMVLPNFKKKSNPLTKTMSFDSPTQLATKIKVSKTKKQIEQLMKSTQKIKESNENSPKKQAFQEIFSQDELQIHKPAPSIPKVMPIKQRRKIRLEIEKLFNLGDEPIQKQEDFKQQSKIEEKKEPKQVKRQQQKNNQDKLRFSLGSRPAFLDQLKFPNKQKD